MSSGRSPARRRTNCSCQTVQACGFAWDQNSARRKAARYSTSSRPGAQSRHCRSTTPGPSVGGVRGADGFGFYHNRGPAEPTPSLVYVFTDGEVWTINTFFALLTADLILLDETKFVKSLAILSIS